MSSETKKMDATQRQQIMATVQQQIALQNAQELLQKLSDKCFKICVQKPGSSLSSSEQVRLLRRIINEFSALIFIEMHHSMFGSIHGCLEPRLSDLCRTNQTWTDSFLILDSCFSLILSFPVPEENKKIFSIDRWWSIVSLSILDSVAYLRKKCPQDKRRKPSISMSSAMKEKSEWSFDYQVWSDDAGWDESSASQSIFQDEAPANVKRQNTNWLAIVWDVVALSAIKKDRVLVSSVALW